MIRIRKVYDDSTFLNRKAIKETKDLIKLNFPLIHNDKINYINEHISNPLKSKLKAVLFIAEDYNNVFKGFGLLFHATDIKFSFLDFMAVKKEFANRGVGSAIYERVQEDAKTQSPLGLFYECLPDDEA